MNSCNSVQQKFSPYLDGAISGREMQSIAAHLDACPACRQSFDTLRGMQRVLASTGPVKLPADLGLKLRLAISHESARRQSHWHDTLTIRWENLLRPMLLQASAGLACALILVGTLVAFAGVAPTSVLANDEPLGALTTPHFLYSAARQQPIKTVEDTTIVIEADVNASGRVYQYQIVSGPTDIATDTQVRDQLILQIYEPARIFGEPTRGRVLITFAGVSVHA